MLLARLSILLAKSVKIVNFRPPIRFCLLLAYHIHIGGKNLIILIIIRVECLFLQKMQAKHKMLQAAIFELKYYAMQACKQPPKSPIFGQIFCPESRNFGHTNTIKVNDYNGKNGTIF